MPSLLEEATVARSSPPSATRVVVAKFIWNFRTFKVNIFNFSIKYTSACLRLKMNNFNEKKNAQKYLTPRNDVTGDCPPPPSNSARRSGL